MKLKLTKMLNNIFSAIIGQYLLRGHILYEVVIKTLFKLNFHKKILTTYLFFSYTKNLSYVIMHWSSLYTAKN